MQPTALPPLKYLQECFSYNARTGHLPVKVRPAKHFKSVGAANSANTKFAGTVAGSPTSTGHLQVSINLKRYLVHRIAWYLHYGKEPPDDLDHRDEDKTNNRIRNLRVATSSQNKCNVSTRRDNTSGARNVYWNKDKCLWVVFVAFKGVRHYGGSSKDIDVAKRLASNLRKKVHQEFAIDARD